MSPNRGWLYLGLYIVSVVAANVITASTVRLSVMIGNTLSHRHLGTWFIGVTFFMRDAVQVPDGRKVASNLFVGAPAIG